MTDQSTSTTLLLTGRSVSDKVQFWFGVGLGSGLLPKAPGTYGSLVALLFTPLMLWLGLGYSLLFCALLALVGVPICSKTAQIYGVHDDGRIVFDEWAGQSISLLPVVWFATSTDLSTEGILLMTFTSFVLFRLFDVLKPQPIGWLDQHVHGGLGIMLDDLLAGVMAALVLWTASTQLL